MDLVRRVNSTYNQIIPHLIALEKEGIVSEQRFGRIRIIKLEMANDKTLLLIKALKILNIEQEQSKVSTISKTGSNYADP
jgi:hypothetical protein